MKATMLFSMRSQFVVTFSLLASLVRANIVFNYVQPNCETSICLRGQICAPDFSCIQRVQEPDIAINATRSQASSKDTISGRDGEDPPVTKDGTCGANNGGTTCGDFALGNCCSMYGYCGNDTAHCGEGCQSGSCLKPPVNDTVLPAPLNANPGSFTLLKHESGVPAMHAALMPNNRVVFLDKVENYTQLILPNGELAYSCEYDPDDLSAPIALAYKTNAFCAGGTFLSDGTLISVGGNADLPDVDPTVANGFKGIRWLTRSSIDPTSNGQSWVENSSQLSSERWYPTLQTLADGTVFVASGSLNGLDPTIPANNNPTFELLSSAGVSSGMSTRMSILEAAQPVYMYPFLHLLPTGDIFVFVSTICQTFNPQANAVVKSLPDLPGDYRTYPNTGGSVMLPLSSANAYDPEVLICGGGAYQDLNAPTDPSCGRINPLADKPVWKMDAMPSGRSMGDMILLPDGSVLLINGAEVGAQGYENAKEPTLTPLIYEPSMSLGQRWSRGSPTEIPRLYHSVALLLLDGTVLVTGSNPHPMPIREASKQYPHPTEFRVERYTPPYLSGSNASRRPYDITLSETNLQVNSSTLEISFAALPAAKKLQIALYHGGFVTHTVHMGHRMIFLDSEGWSPGTVDQLVRVSMPPTNAIAPPGPYVLYVVVDGVPGNGTFVMVA